MYVGFSNDTETVKEMILILCQVWNERTSDDEQVTEKKEHRSVVCISFENLMKRMVLQSNFCHKHSFMYVVA